MVNSFWTSFGASTIAAIVTTIGIYVIRRFDSWGRGNSIDYFLPSDDTNVILRQTL